MFNNITNKEMTDYIIKVIKSCVTKDQLENSRNWAIYLSIKHQFWWSLNEDIRLAIIDKTNDLEFGDYLPFNYVGCLK